MHAARATLPLRSAAVWSRALGRRAPSCFGPPAHAWRTCGLAPHRYLWVCALCPPARASYVWPCAAHLYLWVSVLYVCARRAVCALSRSGVCGPVLVCAARAVCRRALRAPGPVACVCGVSGGVLGLPPRPHSSRRSWCVVDIPSPYLMSHDPKHTSKQRESIGCC